MSLLKTALQAHIMGSVGLGCRQEVHNAEREGGDLAASRSPCRQANCAWDALACSAAAPSCCWVCASSSVMREHTPSCRCRYGSYARSYALSSGYMQGTGQQLADSCNADLIMATVLAEATDKPR